MHVADEICMMVGTVSWCYLGEDEIVPVGCGDHENLELPIFVHAVRNAPAPERGTRLVRARTAWNMEDTMIQ